MKRISLGVKFQLCIVLPWHKAKLSLSSCPSVMEAGSWVLFSKVLFVCCVCIDILFKDFEPFGHRNASMILHPAFGSPQGLKSDICLKLDSPWAGGKI